MATGRPSDPSIAHLLTLDPFVQGAALDLVNAARDAGVPLIVISGKRSLQHNAAVGGAPRSLHLSGLAFDVQVLGYRVADIPAWWWEELGAVAESLGLRWGGRFSAPDVNHFDAGATTRLPPATPLPPSPSWSAQERSYGFFQPVQAPEPDPFFGWSD